MKKCEFKVWKLEDFGDAMLPKYQRTVVWSSQQRKKLFETITKQYPFGSILLYKRDIPGKETRYQIIDGLQRVSTIKHITKYRKVYYDDFDFNQFFSLLDGCCHDATEQGEVRFRNMNCDERDYFREQVWRTFEIRQDSSKYSQSLFSRVNGFCSEEELHIVCDAIFDEFNKDFNPNDIEIPVVIYKGDIDVLPEIFERLNSSGTKLSRFDVYSALWSKYTFKVTDIDVLDKIDERYRSMNEKSGFIIDGYTDGCIYESNVINLHEYCYALGMVLVDKVPSWFIDKKTCGAVGFFLLSALFLGDTADMGMKLPGYLKQFDDGDYGNQKTANLLNEVKNAIIDVSRELAKIMERNFCFNGINAYNYSEYQFVSMAATLFKIKFEISSDGHIKDALSKNKKSYDKFQKNVVKRYLYEQISSSGTTIGFPDVIRDVLSVPLARNRFLTKVNKSSMEEAINSWLKKESEKDTTAKISNKAKLILAFIVSKNKMSIPDGEKLQFTYAVPKDILRNNLEPGSFSTLGNVAIAPKYQAHQKKTYYQAFDGDVFDDDFLGAIYYPTEASLSVFSSPFKKGDFSSFRNERDRILREAFLNMF